MKKLVLAIPHSHTWFWTQSCIASLLRNPPRADGVECEIVVVNNSPWSPAIKGAYPLCKTITDNHRVVSGIVDNHKSNKFHASALDCVVETFDFDYLMAWETDVLALRPTWLEWLLSQLKPTDFAVGHWHHEQFVNPSCTLYRGDVLRSMLTWCKNRGLDMAALRWGERFGQSQPIADRQPERDYQDWYDNQIEWIVGPFADKRGWPVGTELRERPSGQMKGPGWYEPGQMLHHWAVEQGYTYTICPTATTMKQPGMPIMTFYGSEPIPMEYDRQLEFAEMAGASAETVHLWGGTRALDIIKHEVTCDFVKANTPFWLEREARIWRDSVPADVQRETVELIRRYGWHYRGAGTPDVTDRDRAAVRMVQECYARGGVVI